MSVSVGLSAMVLASEDSGQDTVVTSCSSCDWLTQSRGRFRYLICFSVDFRPTPYDWIHASLAVKRHPSPRVQWQTFLAAL